MNADKQKLHVVVRHRQNSDQRWANGWLDDDRLEKITTTVEIGELCAEAKARGEIVLVHRCGWADLPPLVCCAASVIRVAPIDQRTSEVTFAAQQVRRSKPLVAPHLGQNYYWAICCDDGHFD